MSRVELFRHKKTANGTGLRRGFTIVELLIIVVIIGILAAIALTVFSRAQKQARDSHTISTVKAYQKALIAYATDNRAYPTTWAACLGEGNADGCWAGSNDATFNTRIRPYMSNANPLPLPSIVDFTGWGGTREGATFYPDNMFTLDGSTYPWGLTCYLEAATKCPVGPIMAPAEPPYWPNFSSTPAQSNYTEIRGSEIMCRLKLPDPSTL
ncbi:prepilin-type N-terminal cleavage/methylation domain-containing protein [Candidatus Saccharibacteria bacterium]|nr:prepilin-type N-terminal cleavage/methylation domain-containing protein [Candidatus Saccharibacteria bacterium]